MFGFKRRSGSGHEISKTTIDEFLADKNIIPAEAVASSNERRIKLVEKKKELIDKTTEVRALLREFESVLPDKDRDLLLSQINFIERALDSGHLSLEWLDNSIEFMERVLEQLKDKI